MKPIIFRSYSSWIAMVNGFAYRAPSWRELVEWLEPNWKEVSERR